MAYRTPPTPCENHPLTDGSDACVACAATLCDTCAAYDGLRSWCQACATAERHRATRRGRVRAVAGAFTVAALLLVCARIGHRSPTETLRASFLDPNLPTVTWRY